MEQLMIDAHMGVLTEMAEYVEEHIPYAQIVEISYDIDNKVGEVICKIVLSRGTSEYKVAFNWCGVISSYSKTIPKMMLIDIHNGICGAYLKGIYEEMKSKSVRS